MSDDDAPGVIAFRLSAIERQMEEIRQENKEMRQEMRGSFAGLAFVSRETYDNNRVTDKDFAAETRKIAENARQVAWANAGLLLAAVTVLLGVIKAVAG